MLVSWTVSIADGHPTESRQAIPVVQKEHGIEVLAVHVSGDIVPVMATWRKAIMHLLRKGKQKVCGSGERERVEVGWEERFSGGRG